MHHQLRTFAAAFWLFGALSAAAQAEPIPRATLAADHRKCIADCTQRGMALASCTQICDCTFKQIGEQFTLEEYTAGSTAAAQNQPPPKDLIERMTKIAESCMTGMQ
jgi:hypothetical protein